MYRYTQADLLRILRITVRQLAAWEKAGLVAAAESYSFFELLQVKKVPVRPQGTARGDQAIAGSHAEAGCGDGKPPA